MPMVRSVEQAEFVLALGYNNITAVLLGLLFKDWRKEMCFLLIGQQKPKEVNASSFTTMS